MQENFAHRLSRSFKPRFAVIYPFGIFVTFCCCLTKASLEAGIGFIIAGLLIRLWSNGYAIKNDKLTTSGPYAFVRNPLYVGTFLIAIGFVIVLKMDPRLKNWGMTDQLEWLAGGIFLLALGFMYYKTIRGEQGMLLAKFKDAYKDYCQHVPAMIPSVIAYSKGEKWPFDLKRLINSKEHKPVCWVFIILIVFGIKTRVLIEHRGFDDKTFMALAIAVFLILLDITYEFNKKKFK